MTKPTPLNKALTQYLETALWSSIDDDGIPLDHNRSIQDIDLESIQIQSDQLNRFIKDALSLIPEVETYSLSDLAHDFWLTRNGHGAGFWDRDLGPIGDKLTSLAHKFGEVDLYIRDDGRLYFT